MADSDIALSGLITVPGSNQLKLEWLSNDPNSNGLPYLKRAAVEIWSSTTNQRNTASKTGEAVASDDFLHAGLTSGVARYYWLRVRNAAGFHGEWEPLDEGGGTSGTPT